MASLAFQRRFERLYRPAPMLAATGCADLDAAMGDLRNKIAKIERAIATKRAFENFIRAGGQWPKPRKAAPPIRCLCGFTMHEVQIWAVDRDGWPRHTDFYCVACIPLEDAADGRIDLPEWRYAVPATGCTQFTADPVWATLTALPEDEQ